MSSGAPNTDDQPDRIVSVLVGTRPELIKTASTIRALRTTTSLETLVIFSGQHAELLEEAARSLEIVPDHSIAPLPRGRALTDVLAMVVSELGRLIGEKRPHCLMVQGDTVSALAGALVCELMDVPLVHLEAGVRSRLRNDPFPEETIRRMISPIAEFNLCLSQDARQNLLLEGVQESLIKVVPHPLLDHVSALDAESTNVASGRILITLHRRERRHLRLRLLVEIIEQLRSSDTGLNFRFVWHPSLDMDSSELCKELEGLGVDVLQPLPPPQFLTEVASASVVVTDSAGVAEEAELMGKPLIVLRDSAETRLDAGPIADRLITEDSAEAIGFLKEHGFDSLPLPGVVSESRQSSGSAIAAQVVSFLDTHWLHEEAIAPRHRSTGLG